jgi:hypothetical protein
MEGRQRILTYVQSVAPGLGIGIGIAVGFDIDPDSDSDTDFETAGPINYLKVLYTVRRKHTTPPKGFAGQELAHSKLKIYHSMRPAGFDTVSCAPGWLLFALSGLFISYHIFLMP